MGILGTILGTPGIGHDEHVIAQDSARTDRLQRRHDP